MTESIDSSSVSAEAFDQVEPHGYGLKGMLDLRKKAIRDAAVALLEPVLAGDPELAVLKNRLRAIGETIVQRLWMLLGQLEQYERAIKHLYEELERTQERLSDLPPFRYDEPRDIAKARYGVEQLRSQLGHELRETHRRWLEARSDAEKDIAELLTTYTDVLNQAQAPTSTAGSAPSLKSILCFLNEPPAQEVLILSSPEPVQGCVVRVP